MAIAEIHGKTPYDYFEDILTADVFTAFRYLPADRGIIGFLRSVPGLEAKIPLPDKNSTCTIHFWPVGHSCRREPDLLLELDIGGSTYHVVVEAKYLSGPSDLEAYEAIWEGAVITLGSQLGDQCRDLLSGAYTVYDGSTRDRHKELPSTTENRFLMYLTAHIAPPAEELASSTRACPELAPRLFWTSWYHVYDYLETMREQLEEFPYDRLIADVQTLLKKKGFAAFQGIRLPPLLDLEGACGSFWKLFTPLSDTELGEAQGSFWRLCEPPPAMDLANVSGRFWEDAGSEV